MNFKELTKKEKRTFVLSIVLIVLGVLFCVLSQPMRDIIETICCVVSLAYGGFYLIAYCVVSNDTREVSQLFQSILAIVIGFLIMFVRSFFVMAVGILIAGTGISRIMVGVKMKKVNEKDWWHELVVGLILAVLGVVLVILCNTKVASIVVMIYLGVLLILSSALNLYMIYARHKFPVAKGKLAEVEVPKTEPAKEESKQEAPVEEKQEPVQVEPVQTEQAQESAEESKDDDGGYLL